MTDRTDRTTPKKADKEVTGNPGQHADIAIVLTVLAIGSCVMAIIAYSIAFGLVRESLEQMRHQQDLNEPIVDPFLFLSGVLAVRLALWRKGLNRSNWREKIRQQGMSIAIKIMEYLFVMILLDLALVIFGMVLAWAHSGPPPQLHYVNDV